MPDVTSPDGCTTWPVDITTCEDWTDVPDATGAMALSIAVSNLYYLTGARFGQCQTTYRPCIAPDQLPLYRTGGVARDTGSARSRLMPGYSACSSCHSSDLSTLTLPGAPIASVDDMTVDGAPVDLDLFAIQNRRTIIRQDGGSFPAHQDFTLPLTEEGTWSITTTHGTALPDTAPLVAAYYACELARAMLDLPCALPDTAVSVQRQGINYEFASPEWIMRGLVGNNTIDMFILTLNPHRLTRPPSIASVDSIANAPVVETWTGAGA